LLTVKCFQFMKPLPRDVLPVNKVKCITKRYSCHISTRAEFFLAHSHANVTKHKKSVSHSDIHIYERNVVMNVYVLSARNIKMSVRFVKRDGKC